MKFSIFRWEEFCQEIIVEKAGWFVPPSLSSVDEALKSRQDDEQLVKWRFEMPNQISHVEIFGVELPIKKKMINKERQVMNMLIFSTEVHLKWQCLCLGSKYLVANFAAFVVVKKHTFYV